MPRVVGAGVISVSMVSSEAGVTTFFLATGRPFLRGATTVSGSTWGSGRGVITEMVSDEVLMVSDPWTVIEVIAGWSMCGEGGSSSTSAEGGVSGLSTVVTIGSAGGGVGSSRRYS